MLTKGHPKKPQPTHPAGSVRRHIINSRRLRVANEIRNSANLSPPIVKGQSRDSPCLRCERSATEVCHDAIGREDKCYECCIDSHSKSQGVPYIPFKKTDSYSGRLPTTWVEYKQKMEGANRRKQNDWEKIAVPVTAESSDGESSSTMRHPEDPEETLHHTQQRESVGITVGSILTRPTAPHAYMSPYVSQTPSQAANLLVGLRRRESSQVVYERRPDPETTKEPQPPASTNEERDEIALSMMKEERELSRIRPVSTRSSGTRSSSLLSDNSEGRISRGRQRNTSQRRTRSISILSDRDEGRRRLTRGEAEMDRDNMALLPNYSPPEFRELREIQGRLYDISYRRIRCRSPRFERCDERRYRTRSPYQETLSEWNDNRIPDSPNGSLHIDPRVKEEPERERAQRTPRHLEQLNNNRQVNREGGGELEMEVNQADPVTARRTRIKKALHDLMNIVVDFFVH